MDFTFFTIAFYQIYAMAGSNKHVRVVMYDGNNTHRGNIDFIKDYSGTSNYQVDALDKIHAFMPLEKLHVILDILRYEKPVYFAVTPNSNAATLITGREPTGEEELT